MGNTFAHLCSRCSSRGARDQSHDNSSDCVDDEVQTALLPDDVSTDVLQKARSIDICSEDQNQATDPLLSSSISDELSCAKPEIKVQLQTLADPTPHKLTSDSRDERTKVLQRSTSVPKPLGHQEQAKDLSNSTTLSAEHSSTLFAKPDPTQEEAHPQSDNQLQNAQTSMNDDQLVAKFRQHATRYYLEDYCHVMTNPWEIENVEDPDTFLDRYFVNLSLWREEDGIGRVTKIPLERSHNQLFDPEVEGKKSHRILVFGEGGTGKSTLCKKLAYDWAKGTADSPLKDVPILCVVEFRKLQESDNIVDAIHNQLLPKDSDITPDHIRQFIKSNPSKIVIVLDGFDEFDPNTHQGDIKDLLNCKIMANVTVLVTTRPWHACLLQKKKRMYVQICLEGFDESAVETYVRKYFSNSQEANQCLKRIRASRIAHYFARTPILLIMICFLQKVCSEDEGEIRTLNSLFEKFLRAVYVNFMQKECTTSGIGLSQSSRADMCVFDEFWGSLGGLALKGIVSPGKRLVFSRNDVRGIEDVCELAIKMGLIVKQKIPFTKRYALESPEFVFSFPHFLFQEKCAGDYLATNESILDSTLLSAVSNDENALFMQYTLAFSSGKRWHEENDENRERAHKIVKHLVNVQRDSKSVQSVENSALSNETLAIQTLHGNRRLFLLGILINYESQSAGRLLKDILKLDQQGRVQYYDGMLYDSLIYFLQFAISNEDIRLQRCTQVVMENDIDSIPLSTVLPLVSVAYRQVEQVMCYSTADVGIPEVKLADIDGYLDKPSQILSLDICKTTSPVNIHDLLYFLATSNVALGRLTVTNCPVLIRYQDGEKLENGLCKNTSCLKDIHIKYVTNEIALPELLQITTLMCPQLEELVISGETILLSRHSTKQLCLTKTSNIRDITVEYTDQCLSLLDLIGLITFMCPRIQACTLKHMEIELPSNVAAVGFHSAQFEEQSSLQELTMYMVKILNMKGPLSIIPILTSVAELCPALKFLRLKLMQVITADMDFCMNVIDLWSRTKLPIESMEITDNHFSVSLLELLRITAILCPNLKICKLNHLALHIPTYDRLFGKLIVEKSSLEVLEMSNIEKSWHNVIDVQVLCGMLCPNLNSCQLNGADIEIYR